MFATIGTAKAGTQDRLDQPGNSPRKYFLVYLSPLRSIIATSFMKCWKCGQDSGENVECERCLNINVTYTHAPPGNAIPIDWNKVRTIEDVKIILSVFGLSVIEGSPSAHRLQRFLM